MPTISTSKPVFTLPSIGRPTQRTIRFAGNETPDVSAQGAAAQAEVKAKSLTTEEKEILEKSLTIYEKLSPSFMARVGQRIQAFFKGIWHSIRLLFINKTMFALEKAQSELKDKQIEFNSSDKVKKATQEAVDTSITKEKAFLKDCIQKPDIDSTIKERAQRALKSFEEREKSGQAEAYLEAILVEAAKRKLEEEIKSLES